MPTNLTKLLLLLLLLLLYFQFCLTPVTGKPKSRSDLNRDWIACGSAIFTEIWFLVCPSLFNTLTVATFLSRRLTHGLWSLLKYKLSHALCQTDTSYLNVLTSILFHSFPGQSRSHNTSPNNESFGDGLCRNFHQHNSVARPPVSKCYRARN